MLRFSRNANARHMLFLTWFVGACAVLRTLAALDSPHRPSGLLVFAASVAWPVPVAAAVPVMLGMAFTGALLVCFVAPAELIIEAVVVGFDASKLHVPMAWYAGQDMATFGTLNMFGVGRGRQLLF